MDIACRIHCKRTLLVHTIQKGGLQNIAGFRHTPDVKHQLARHEASTLTAPHHAQSRARGRGTQAPSCLNRKRRIDDRGENVIKRLRHLCRWPDSLLSRAKRTVSPGPWQNVWSVLFESRRRTEQIDSRVTCRLERGIRRRRATL